MFLIYCTDDEDTAIDSEGGCLVRTGNTQFEGTASIPVPDDDGAPGEVSLEVPRGWNCHTTSR